MATFTVTTNLDTGDDQSVTGDLAAETADGGGLSLREAILLANAAAGADTIVFAGSTGEAFEAGGTITLSGSELTLSTDITIDGDVSGDGRADVIIDANDASRVFHVSGGSSTLASLDLRNGRSTGDGGAVLINAGATLAIDRTTIRDSDAANGGAIANAGTLDLTTSTISGGSTSGGGGGIHSTGTTNLINATIHGASGFGAGIYVLAGTTTVLNSTLTGNSSDLSFAQGILVESFATLDIANSIVVGNGGSPGSGNGVLGFIDSTITASNTLTTGEAAQIFAQTAVIPGSAVAGGRLADNGGPVETVALRFHGSNPALDAGDDTRAPATDALGNPRVDQPNVGADGANFSDLGAVELQTVLPLPTLTGFGGTVAHTENGPAVVLDTDATIADADADALNGGLGDYAGSSLTVARAGGAEVLDLFGFDAGATSFMAMNGRLYDQNGDAFADVVNSGGRLTVNFTSQDTVATSALVQDVLRSITYATASEAPEDVTVEAAFRGIFGAPVAATVDVDVTGVNSAPTFEVLDPPVVEGTLASGLNVRSGVLGTSVLLQLAVVGDVNGDGIEEVAVSAPRAFLSSAIAGGYALLVDGATGAVLQDHRGTAPFDTLGASIAGVGDVDGDGVVDWAAGLDRSFNPGSVQIYSGASGSVIRTINGGDNFGQAIAGGFDFNGDSVPDIAVVAQRAVSVRSGADGTSLFSVSTPSTFAPAIANAGDVDSDGRNDLIVGDPGFDGAGGRDTGAVSIYSGDGGALLFRIEGSAADESFGLEVGGIGDVDGDGHDDIAASAFSTGTTRIFSGADGSLLYWVGTTGQIRALHDIDGDGTPDFSVGGRIHSGADGETIGLIGGGIAFRDTDSDGRIEFVRISGGRLEIVSPGGMTDTVDGSISYEAGRPPVILDDFVRVSDRDFDARNEFRGDYDGASVTVMRQGGADAGDNYSVAPTANLIIAGSRIFTADGLIATFDNTGGVLTINFSHNGDAIPTSALVGEVLSSIQYDALPPAPNGIITLAWTFSDGEATATGTSQVTFLPDDPGVAADDAFSIASPAPLSGNVFADNGNGPDVDVDTPLEVTAVDGNAANVGTQITLPSGALLTVNADGTFDYDPNGALAANGDTDSFTYELTGTDTATITITLDDMIAPLAATADTANADEDGPAIQIELTANDTGADPEIAALDTTGTQGTVSVNADNDTVTYDPNGAFEALGAGDFATDTFTYDVTDSSGGTETATVTVSVAGQNDDPTATGLPSDLAVVSGTLSDLDLSASTFADVDGDTLAFTLAVIDGTLSAPGGSGVAATLSNGDRTLTLTGTAAAINAYLATPANVQYLAATGDLGDNADSLAITVNDGHGSGDIALAPITIDIAEAIPTGTPGDNMMTGGPGDDRLFGYAGDDTIDGQSGNDALFGGNGNDHLIGGAGDDSAYGGGGNDLIEGGIGNDYLVGGDGDDVLEGDDGDDYLYGNTGADQLSGGDGLDRLFIDEDDTLIDGGAGTRDRVLVQQLSASTVGVTVDLAASHVEVAFGGDNDDTFDGSASTDDLTIYGRDGEDMLLGGAGNDRLFGDGNDGAAGDILNGGRGNDFLRGGVNAPGGFAERDQFVFDAEWGSDRIFDFADNGAEAIDFSSVAGIDERSDLTITDVTDASGTFALISYTDAGGWTGTIRVYGVAEAQLQDDDFIYA